MKNFFSIILLAIYLCISPNVYAEGRWKQIDATNAVTSYFDTQTIKIEKPNCVSTWLKIVYNTPKKDGTKYCLLQIKFYPDIRKYSEGKYIGFDINNNQTFMNDKDFKNFFTLYPNLGVERTMFVCQEYIKGPSAAINQHGRWRDVSYNGTTDYSFDTLTLNRPIKNKINVWLEKKSFIPGTRVLELVQFDVAHNTFTTIDGVTYEHQKVTPAKIINPQPQIIVPDSAYETIMKAALRYLSSK